MLLRYGGTKAEPLRPIPRWLIPTFLFWVSNLRQQYFVMDLAIQRPDNYRTEGGN